MWNKKNLLLGAFIFIFLFLLLVILSFSSRKKGGNENISPTETLLPTKVIIQKRITPTPTLSDENLQLSTIKNKLINGYEFEDVVLDYRPKTDLIIVFYNQSKLEAQDQVVKFFKEEGINNLDVINIEYIGLKKDPEEPPAGYFR